MSTPGDFDHLQLRFSYDTATWLDGGTVYLPPLSATSRLAVQFLVQLEEGMYDDESRYGRAIDKLLDTLNPTYMDDGLPANHVVIPRMSGQQLAFDAETRDFQLNKHFLSWSEYFALPAVKTYRRLDTESTGVSSMLQSGKYDD